MKKARIYVDLNEMVTDDIVLLSKGNTKIDSMGSIITFYEGMDNLIFEGTAIKYDLKRYPEWRHVKWCARIDWNSLMHESDMNQSNSIE